MCLRTLQGSSLSDRFIVATRFRENNSGQYLVNRYLSSSAGHGGRRSFFGEGEDEDEDDSAILPHRVLGVKPGATQAEIKRQFLTLAHRYHPDKSGSAESAKKFVQVRRAFELLSDGKSRGRGTTFVDNLEHAVKTQQANDILEQLSAIISNEATVQYEDFFPAFLTAIRLLPPERRHREAFDYLALMDKAGMLPDELLREAYSDLLLSTAEYEESVDFGMEIINEMEARKLRPDMEACLAVFKYFGGVN